MVLLARHSLAQRLQDEIVAVAIDNESGEKVGFGENQSVGNGVFDDASAVVDGGTETSGKECSVDGLGGFGGRFGK